VSPLTARIDRCGLITGGRSSDSSDVQHCYRKQADIALIAGQILLRQKSCFIIRPKDIADFKNLAQK
jgi:hypothetical protein